MMVMLAFLLGYRDGNETGACMINRQCSYIYLLLNAGLGRNAATEGEGKPY